MSTAQTPINAATPGPPYPGLTLGQLIDRTFRLLRARFRLFAGLAAAPSAAIALLAAIEFGVMLATVLPELRHHLQPDPRRMMWTFAPFTLGYIAIFPIFALYAAAAAHAVVSANVGAKISSSGAWAIAWRVRGRAIWLAFLMLLLIAGPVYLVLGVGVGSLALSGVMSTGRNATPPPQILFLFPVFFLLIIGSYVSMILVFLRYSLSFATLVVEGLPAKTAMRRSAELTRGAKGRIFLLLLVAYAAVFAVTLICEVLIFVAMAAGLFVAAVFHLSSHSPLTLFLAAPLALLLLAVFCIGICAFSYAAYSTALGVLYCDQYYRANGSLPVLPPAEEPV
jgi:hypothetical protein